MNLVNSELSIEKPELSSKLKLLICIVICLGVGFTSSLLSATKDNVWFDSISKPSWNPPDYIFGPVWTILYLMMAFSLWIIWKRDIPKYRKFPAELLFASQLFLNFWWSIIFFRFHSPKLAFIEILFLILFILLTIFKFARISKLAAWLLVPYVSWVCFAAILNYNLWILNQ